MDKSSIREKLLSGREIKPSPDGCYPDCWWWKRRETEISYGKFCVHNKSYKVHRLSAYVSYLIDPDGNEFTLNSRYFICHKCDNPPCFNPEHLFIGTQKDNRKDMFEKGRESICKGELLPQSKLTEQDVIEIRDLYAFKRFHQYELAKIYNIGQDEISRIINYKRWSHI